jgi:hypothetical protein
VHQSIINKDNSLLQHPKFSSILSGTADWTALAQKNQTVVEEIRVEIGTIAVAIKRFAANGFEILF